VSGVCTLCSAQAAADLRKVPPPPQLTGGDSDRGLDVWRVLMLWLLLLLLLQRSGLIGG